MLRRLSAALPSIPKPPQSRSNSIAEPREEITSPSERAETRRDSRPPTPVRVSTPVLKREDEIDTKSEATSEKLEDLNVMVKKEFQIIYRNIDRINDILNLRRRSTVTSAVNSPRRDSEVTFFDDTMKFPSQASDFGWSLDDRINNAVDIKFNQQSDQMTSLTSEIQLLKDQNQQILKELSDPSKGGRSSNRDEEVAELKKDLQLMKVELSQLKLTVQQLTNSLEPNNTTSAFTAPIFPKKEALRGNAKSEIDDTAAKIVKPPIRPFETPVSKSGSEEKSNYNNGLRAMVTNPIANTTTASAPSNHINDSAAKLQENIIQTSECQGINRIIQLSEKLNEIGPFTSLLRITVNVFKHFKCNKSAAREFILRLNHLCLILCEFIELTYPDSTSNGPERALIPEARVSTDNHQIHAPAASPPAPSSALAAVWSLNGKEQTDNLRTTSNSSISLTTSIDATNGRFSIPISSERMQIIQQNQHLIQIELQKSLIILKELLHKTQKYFIIFNKFGFFTERLLHGYESRHYLRNFDLEFTNELINICSKFLKYQCFKDREYSIYIQKIDYAGKYTNFVCDVEAIYGPNGKPSSEYADRQNFLGSTKRIGSTLFDDPTAVILDAASSNLNPASSILPGDNTHHKKYEPLNVKDVQLLERLKSDLQMTQSDFITEIDYYILYIEKKSHSFYYKLIEYDWNYYIIQHPALKHFWKLRFYNQNYIDKLFFLTNLYDYLVKYENCNIIYCEKLIKQLIPILDIMNEVYSSFIHDPLIHQQPQQQHLQQLTQPGKYGKSNQVHSQPVPAPVVTETVIDYKIDIFKMNQYTKYFPHHYTLQQLIEQLLIQVYPYQMISLPSSSSSKLLLDPPDNQPDEQSHQGTNFNASSKLLLELSIEKVEKSLFAPSSGISIVVGGENLGKSTTLLHYLHHTYLPNLLQRNHFYQHVQKLYHSILWIDCAAFPLPSKIFTINPRMDAFAPGAKTTANQHFHDEYSDELLFSLLQYLNDYFSFGILCTEREWEQLRSSSDTQLSQYPLYQELRNFFNLLLAKQRKLNTKGSSSQLAESKVTLVFDNIKFVQIIFFSPLWSILSEFIDHFHIILIISKPNSPASTSQLQLESANELIDRVRNELIQYFGDTKTVHYRDYRYEEFIVSFHNNNQEISTKIESYLLSLNNTDHHSSGLLTDGDVDTKDSAPAESPQLGSTVSYLSQYCNEICNIFQYQPILISMFSPYFTEEIIVQLVQDLIIYEQGQVPPQGAAHAVVGANKTIKSSQSFISVKPFVSALKEQLLYYFLSINDIIILYALIPLLYLPHDPQHGDDTTGAIPSISSLYREGQENEEGDSEEAEEGITVSEEMIYNLVKDAFPKSNENIVIFKECLERLTQFQLITKVTSSTTSSFLNQSHSDPNGTANRGPIGNYTEYVINRKNVVLISFFDYITVQNRFHSQFAKQTTLVNRLMSIYNALKQWIERQPNTRTLTLNDEVSLQIYQTSLKNYYEYIDHHYLYPVYKLLVYHGNYIFTTLQAPSSSSEKSNNGNAASSAAAVPSMNLLEDISTNDTITSTLLPPSSPAAMNFPLQQANNNPGSSNPSAAALSDNNYCLNDLILLLYAMRHRYHIHQYLAHFFHYVQSLHHHHSTASTPTPPPAPAATAAPVINSFTRGKSQTLLSSDKRQINYFEEKNHVFFLTKAMEYLGKFFFTTHLTRKVYLYLFTYFFYFPSSTARAELNLFSDFIHQIHDVVVKSSVTTSLATAGSLRPIEVSLLTSSAPTPTSTANPVDVVKDVLMKSNTWRFQPLYRYYLVFVLRNLADLYLILGAKATARSSSPGVNFQESVSSAASLLHVSEGAMMFSPVDGVEEVLPASEISELILLTLFHVAESPEYSAEMQECVLLSTQDDASNPVPTVQSNSDPSSAGSSPLPENPVGRRMSIMRQRQSILSGPTPVKKEESNPASSSSTSSPRRVVITKVEVEVEKSKLFHVMSKIFLPLQKFSEMLLLYEKAMQTMQALYTSHHNDHTEAVAAWLFGNGEKKEEDLFAVYESSHREEVPDTVSPLVNNKRDKDPAGKKKGLPSSVSSPAKPIGRKGVNGKPPVGVMKTPPSAGAAMPYAPSTPAPTIPSTHIPNIHEFHQLVDIGILFYNIAAIQHSMKSYLPSIQHYSQALKVFQHCQQYLQWSNKLISSQRRLTTASSSSSMNGSSTSDMIFIPSLTQSNSAAPSIQPQQHNPRRPSVGGGIEQYYSDQKQHQISLQSHYYSKHIITKIAKTLHCLSTVYYEQGAYSRSLQTSIKLLSYYSQIHGQDHALIANLYHTIGNLSVLTNQKKESIKYYEKALKIYQKVSEQSLIALGKSDHSGHHPSAHDLIHTTHHEEEIAIIFYHLGNVYKSLYMSKESIRNYDKAKNIYKQLLIHAQQIHLQNYSQLSQQHHQMQLPFPSSSLPPVPNSPLLQRPFTVQLPSNSSVASSSGPSPATGKSLTINSTRQHPNAILYYQNIISEIQRQIESL